MYRPWKWNMDYRNLDHGPVLCLHVYHINVIHISVRYSQIINNYYYHELKILYSVFLFQSFTYYINIYINLSLKYIYTKYNVHVHVHVHVLKSCTSNTNNTVGTSTLITLRKYLFAIISTIIITNGRKMITPQLLHTFTKPHISISRPNDISSYTSIYLHYVYYYKYNQGMYTVSLICISLRCYCMYLGVDMPIACSGNVLLCLVASGASLYGSVEFVQRITEISIPVPEPNSPIYTLLLLLNVGDLNLYYLELYTNNIRKLYLLIIITFDNAFLHYNKLEYLNKMFCNSTVMAIQCILHVRIGTYTSDCVTDCKHNFIIYRTLHCHPIIVCGLLNEPNLSYLYRLYNMYIYGYNISLSQYSCKAYLMGCGIKRCCLYLSYTKPR